MAHFPDLSPYAYGHCPHPGVVHVGWLDNMFPYERGAVDGRIVEKMKVLAKTPVELYRGLHFCNLCPLPDPPSAISGIADALRNLPQCSGEIRISREGVTYAAPILIVHYIEDHGYLPPEQFLRAVEIA